MLESDYKKNLVKPVICIRFISSFGMVTFDKQKVMIEKYKQRFY